MIIPHVSQHRQPRRENYATAHFTSTSLFFFVRVLVSGLFSQVGYVEINVHTRQKLESFAAFDNLHLSL